MDAKELIELMTEDVQTTAKEKGLASVPVENLLRYFDERKRSLADSAAANAEASQALLAPADLERYKAELCFWRDQQVALFNATIVTGQNALKNLMLINGGAVIALLAFIGNLYRNGSGPAKDLSLSLVWFGGGVLSAAAASAAGYLCQLCYGHSGSRRETKSFKSGLAFHALAIIGGVLALFAFGYGTCLVYDVFRMIPAPK